MIPKSLCIQRENKQYSLIVNLLRYLLYVSINMTKIGKSSTDFIIKMCRYLSTICQQDTGLPLVVLAVKYSWSATNFLNAHYRNSTGTTIINENIIPLLSTIMKMVANIQDDMLIPPWFQREESFWSYMHSMMSTIYFFDSEKGEASACFCNIVFAIINSAIIPLHAKIANGIIPQSPLHRVTRNLLSLLENTAFVRKIYSKIFTDNMNKHSQKDVDTLLAELNFLMLITVCIQNMDIEEKIRMFKLAKKSWENMLSASPQNNRCISKQCILFADAVFQCIKKYIAKNLRNY